MNKFGNDQEVRLVFFLVFCFWARGECCGGKTASPVCGWAHTGDGCVWMGIVPLFLIFLGLFGNEVGIFEIVDAHGTAYVLECSGCHTASFFATTS